MTKSELRKFAKNERQAFVSGLTTARKCAAAVLLADRIDAQIGDAKTVAVYLPIGPEIDTLPLIERLEHRGAAIALPHVTGRRDTMRFLLWVPGDPLLAGPMGLRQPEASAPQIVPDVILTPLLAFDGDMQRLGYGAGHYDRAFAALPDARRIGLAWSAQRVERVPVDSWDVPLHAIATETEWITA